ncbi:M56 family peptidase (plasmid) [Mycolicibacterium frederiksbergense]|uniref:M56 family peptidase n=1 Tax=Mycolicibacterium frederiksbergense TaxID=117567 RepID=A0A6H0RXX6_9MYCO|nr:M56 family peptidase [Mycolicibacterium frederiksbergense]
MWWSVVGVVMTAMSPRALRWLTRRGADAGVLLLAWAVSVCLTVFAVALPGLTELLRRCWLTLHAGPPGGVDTAIGVVSGGLIAFAAVRGGWHLARAGRYRRRLHARHAELAWVLRGSALRADGVLWLPTSEPHAYSLAGDPPLVVLSTGMRERLDGAAVRAVVAHEQAHLQRRHHLLIAVAHAVAAGLWWLPLTRQSPSLVRTLVELDADAHAARVHGNRPLHRALLSLQDAHAPATALGIAGECVQLRLARLSGRCSPRAGRFAASAAGSTAVLLVTAAVLVVAVLTTALASCTAS